MSQSRCTEQRSSVPRCLLGVSLRSGRWHDQGRRIVKGGLKAHGVVQWETYSSGDFWVSITAAMGIPKLDTGPQKSAARYHVSFHGESELPPDIGIADWDPWGRIEATYVSNTHS